MWSITFVKPIILLLILVAVLLFLVKRRSFNWLGFNIALAQPVGFIKNTVRRLGLFALFLVFVSAIIAWANPMKGEIEKVTKVQARQVCLSYDMSGSMFQEVSKVKKIQVAADAGTEFIDKRDNDMFALVPFDDRAQLALAVPLTLDRAFVKKQLQVIADGSSGGLTAIGEGAWTCLIFLMRDALPKQFRLDTRQLRQAVEADELGPYAMSAVREIGVIGHAFIVVLTDGENNSGINPVKVMNFASRLGVKVYLIAVESQRFPELVRAVERTGGIYFFTKDIKQSKQFYADIDKIEKKEVVIEKEVKPRSLRWYFLAACGISFFVFGVMRFLVIKVP